MDICGSREHPHVDKLRDDFYPKLLIESLRGMRQSWEFCDVILICDFEIPAHRVILSAASPYFRAMFNCAWKESKEERVEINCMDGVVLLAAVDFIYSGELAVDDDLLFPLLEASSLLQLGNLRSVCMQRLVQSATPYSLLGPYCNLANKIGLLELGNFLYRLTIENFETVAFGESKERWLNAPLEAISGIVNHFAICCQPVSLVLKGILEWILHDPSGSREEHLDTLFSALKNVSKPDLDEEIEKLLDQRKDIFDWLSSHCLQSDTVDKTPLMKELQVVVVVGGATDSAMRTVECLKADAQKTQPWTLYLPDHTESQNTLRNKVIDRVVPPMNFLRVDAASAFLDHEIYMIGGEKGTGNSGRMELTMECYNIVMNIWRRMPDIPLPVETLVTGKGLEDPSLKRLPGSSDDSDDRVAQMCDWVRLAGAAAAFVEGELYVCGGRYLMARSPKDAGQHNGNSNKTWTFNISQNKWRENSPMLQARAYHGAASVNGVLYALGGVAGDYDAEANMATLRPLDSVERFDPWVGTWKKVAPMPVPRLKFGCITNDHYIYVMAGSDMEDPKDTVYRYNTIGDNWQFIDNPLRTPVCAVAACSLKYPISCQGIPRNKAFFMGGRTSHSGIREANVYNFFNDRWHCLQSLIYNRIGASAGILRLPVKVKDVSP